MPLLSRFGLSPGLQAFAPIKFKGENLPSLTYISNNPYY
jgi:hypothetical protein